MSVTLWLKYAHRRSLTAGCFFFFFNDTATTEIYTLSLHDALPIFRKRPQSRICAFQAISRAVRGAAPIRSEEHTSELQSQSNIVCRLLLEKKKHNPARLSDHPVDVYLFQCTVRCHSRIVLVARNLH